MLPEVKDFLREIYENPIVTVRTEKERYEAIIGADEIIINKYEHKKDGKSYELKAKHVDNPAFFYKLSKSVVNMFDNVTSPCVEITREFSDDFTSYHYDMVMSKDKITIRYSEKKDGYWDTRDEIEFEKSIELLTFFETIISEIELME